MAETLLLAVRNSELTKATSGPGGCAIQKRRCVSTGSSRSQSKIGQSQNSKVKLKQSSRESESVKFEVKSTVFSTQKVLSGEELQTFGTLRTTTPPW
jgi:hypothetical protein